MVRCLFEYFSCGAMARLRDGLMRQILRIFLILSLVSLGFGTVGAPQMRHWRPDMALTPLRIAYSSSPTRPSLRLHLAHNKLFCLSLFRLRPYPLQAYCILSLRLRVPTLPIEWAACRSQQTTNSTPRAICTQNTHTRHRKSSQVSSTTRTVIPRKDSAKFKHLSYCLLPRSARQITRSKRLGQLLQLS